MAEAQRAPAGTPEKVREIDARRDHGARGDGKTDDTAALRAWGRAIQRAGGGVAVLPRGIYRVSLKAGEVLLPLEGLSGVRIDAGDATVVDVSSYSGEGRATFLRLRGCSNVEGSLSLQSEPSVTTSGSHTRGLVGVSLEKGSTGISLTLKQKGGLAALQCTSEHNSPPADRARQVRANIKATGCYYPYLAQFSGDNADITLDADTCGRNVFIYGVRDQRLTVRSRNQQVTSLIKAYNGFGCSNVNLDFTDLNSTNCSPAAPCIEISWGDKVAATHSNIHLTTALRNPPSGPFGNTIEFTKYADGGGTIDAAGRGHTLSGFRWTGSSDQSGVGNPHLAMPYGAFGPGDRIERVVLGPLELKGAAALFLPATALRDEMVVQDVVADSHLYIMNGTNGVVRFQRVRALNLSASKDSDDRHIYEDCDIVEGSLQSTRNKSFIRTRVAGRRP